MSDSPKISAIYARVSTTGHGQDVGLQLDDLNALVEDREWVLADSYIDDGVSGAKESRPELDRLLDDARAGRFQVLVVWKLDRLSRSLRDLLHIMDLITERKAGFRSLTESIDTTVPAGRMLMQMLGSFADYAVHRIKLSSNGR